MLKEEVKEKKKKERQKLSNESFVFYTRYTCFIVTFIHKSIHCKVSTKKKKNSTKRIRSKDSYKDYYNSIMIETMIVQYWLKKNIFTDWLKRDNFRVYTLHESIHDKRKKFKKAIDINLKE